MPNINPQHIAGYGEPCQHCGIRPVSRARRLCWRCSFTPGVRELYPANGMFGSRGVGLFEPTRKPVPTQAPPGSGEKVDELARRAAAGEELWHRDDGKADMR